VQFLRAYVPLSAVIESGRNCVPAALLDGSIDALKATHPFLVEFLRISSAGKALRKCLFLNAGIEKRAAKRKEIDYWWDIVEIISIIVVLSMKFLLIKKQ
jgi:hypothetical protein